MLDPVFSQEEILKRFEETIRNQTIEEAKAKAKAKAKVVAKAAEYMRSIDLGKIISGLHKHGWDKDLIMDLLVTDLGIDKDYAELQYAMHTR